MRKNKASRKPSTRRWPTLLCGIPQHVLKEFSAEPSFQWLCDQKRFDDILFCITTTLGDFDYETWLFGSGAEYPLHTLLRNQPPLQIVGRVCSILFRRNKNKSPESVVDSMARTALHIACASACSIAVTARILNGARLNQTKNPAAIKDSSGRLPLHCACTNIVAQSYDVVGFLVYSFPEAVRVVDSFGKTPLDLAIDSCASPETISLLFKAKQHLNHPENSPPKVIFCQQASSQCCNQDSSASSGSNESASHDVAAKKDNSLEPCLVEHVGLAEVIEASDRKDSERASRSCNDHYVFVAQTATRKEISYVGPCAVVTCSPQTGVERTGTSTLSRFLEGQRNVENQAGNLKDAASSETCTVATEPISTSTSSRYSSYQSDSGVQAYRRERKSRSAHTKRSTRAENETNRHGLQQVNDDGLIYRNTGHLPTTPPGCSTTYEYLYFL